MSRRRGCGIRSRKCEAERTLLLGIDINSLDEIGEIIRHRGGFLLELLQLSHKGTHEGEAGLVRVLEGILKLGPRKMTQAQLHGFDQALVRKGDEIVVIFRGKLRRADRTFKQSPLCKNQLLIAKHERVDHEVQIGMLNRVQRRIGHRSDGDCIMVPGVAEIRASAHERLDVYSKGAIAHRLSDFAQIGVGDHHNLPERGPVGLNERFRFRFNFGPPSIEVSFLVKLGQKVLKSVNRQDSGRKRIAVAAQLEEVAADRR